MAIISVCASWFFLKIKLKFVCVFFAFLLRGLELKDKRAFVNQDRLSDSETNNCKYAT